MDKKCDKNQQMLSFIAILIEIILFLIAVSLVSKRNKKIMSKRGIAELVAAFFCTPCYIAFALVSKVPKTKA